SLDDRVELSRAVSQYGPRREVLYDLTTGRAAPGWMLTWTQDPSAAGDLDPGAFELVASLERSARENLRDHDLWVGDEFPHDKTRSLDDAYPLTDHRLSRFGDDLPLPTDPERLFSAAAVATQADAVIRDGITTLVLPRE